MTVPKLDRCWADRPKLVGGKAGWSPCTNLVDPDGDLGLCRSCAWMIARRRGRNWTGGMAPEPQMEL